VHVSIDVFMGGCWSTALAVPHSVRAIAPTLRSGVPSSFPDRRLTRVPAGTASATASAAAARSDCCDHREVKVVLRRSRTVAQHASSNAAGPYSESGVDDRLTDRHLSGRHVSGRRAGGRSMNFEPLCFRPNAYIEIGLSSSRRALGQPALS
jgi:hypothetical protein